MEAGKWYRESVLALILLLGIWPALSFSAEITLKSDTIFRMFERDTSTEEDATILPGYEYLQVDGGSLDDYGLSFHLYGWGRTDFTDHDYYHDQADGELLYGYLEYRREENSCNIRLGRQYIFEGVANEAIDGLRLSGDIGSYFFLSLYGGQPVGLDSEQGRGGDSIFGGRLAHHLGTQYEIGVSYKAIENDDETAEEMLGVDLSAFLPANLSLFGNSTYNRETEDWAEHSYELRIPFGNIMIKTYYQTFSYKDYFGTGAKAVNPFRTFALTDEELTAYGVDALWQLDENWTLGGKVKFYDYDERGSAEIYSALLSWQDDDQTQYGGEISHTAADDSSGNDYTLVSLFGYSEKMLDRFGINFVSGDLLLVFYNEEIYGEDRSLFVSLGCGKRFMNNALTVKLSGDFSHDPYFDNDLRGMVTMSYHHE